ncbi:Signal transduction histidine kinase [Peptoniphilus asaccharolyticus DSM 20463]|uniref:histidine kinase n=1 Tax=Peptoniphilus asaccharolyticus DSM 20463 TaxID=573058 RepID=A0A1W1UBH8_PEPAS|nr:HAMP domain-containing sensor histidine kinase [Peptoniphilus asaccharolyticus]MBL7575826.1 HAMP domain-containing histidine kinase [Peptoniphilus asaccharolyticus]MBL7575950.1 HAMP domain-containing histidine kinase [Peptoniphilus asaccharolyticus]SMB78427.1 Signal transduction histidine kinase [Peptoniphilus asaccharolyticus DSM 20463]
MSNKLKNLVKRLLRYLKNTNFLEDTLLRLMIWLGMLFSVYGYVLALGIFSLVVVYKIWNGELKDSIFTLKLFLNSSGNRLYSLFGVLNIFILFIVMVMDYNFFDAFLNLIIFRIIFEGENIYVQNAILNNAIEDLYNFGESFEKSSLADKKTSRTLNMLSSIKEQIRTSINKTMETERLKTELITNISHDLKTPLTSIINYADILSKKTEMDFEAKEYIGVLGRNSERLRSLIIDLIYASKTGSGAIKVEKVFIDFNELVSQIYGDFDELLNKKELEFLYDYGNEEINLYTDPGIVSRIVQNLISNAYKYSKPGTKILGCTKIEERYIHFEMKNETDIPIKENENDLLNELVKSEKARTTEGSGLGLYITKNLAEILGGEFHIAVKDNTFTATVILPIETNDSHSN